jgi:hypothetical protein
VESLHNTTQEAVNAHSSETQATVQYIPIEWHRHIHEATDDMMDDITMTSIPHLRMVNNDYLADAFFYLAEDRHRAIVKHVTATFNSAYRAFRQENPHFGGKIAIMAYSLGGIITWDILSTQKDNPTLAFKPDFLFNLGSPLSAFMTVRNQSPETYHPDESIVFENIFHPYDPLVNYLLISVENT